MSSNVGVCFFQEDYAVEDVPDFDDDDFPFEGEFALSFLDKNPSSVPMGDYRFDKFACEAYNRAFGRNVKALYGEKDSVSAVDPDFCDALLYGGMEDDDMMDRLQCDDSHIGGYLYFTQSVPVNMRLLIKTATRCFCRLTPTTRSCGVTAVLPTSLFRRRIWQKGFLQGAVQLGLLLRNVLFQEDAGGNAGAGWRL